MDISNNEYVNRLKVYQDKIAEQNKSVSTIGYLRLFTFIIGIGVTFYTFSIKSYVISIGVFVVSMAIFIYLISAYNKETKKREYSIALKDINEKALKRLNGQWKNFEDDGSEFKDEQHSYSGDLDIFGLNSLFQWINSTKTFMGRQTLKNRLITPLKTPFDIKMTQQSLLELAMNLQWRQSFEAEGMVISNECINPKQLCGWAKEKNELYSKSWLILLVRLLPAVTIITIILYYSTSLIDYRLPRIMLVIQIIFLFIGLKKRSAAFNGIYKYKNSIDIYQKMLSLINQKDFKSDYLKQLKNNLSQSKEDCAVKAIKKLASIYDKVSHRRNTFFIIINILLLWDYQCMIEFEKWRASSGKNLEKWFDVIGQFEALNSISNIIYDNPKWVMPLVSDGDFIIKAEGLGHPLLGDKRVCNNITIRQQRNILLITGSNMSGKSTFLRTVGINLILSYIGSPVCSVKFECSLMKVFTCMRTSDNLDNNISSFYAEILRIKAIVESVRDNKKVFFLLDELFKGTNSIDRHDGYPSNCQ